MKRETKAGASGLTGPKLLARGIDTLELGIHAELDPLWFEELEVLKGVAKSGCDATTRVAGVPFAVLPTTGGAFTAFKLQNEHWTLSISRMENGKNPALAFKPSCAFLWEVGLEGVWLAAEDIARSLHRGPPAAMKAVLSRIDLAADFQGLGLERARAGDFVSRARHKARRGIRFPGAPVTEFEPVQFGEFRSGDKPTGLSFGSGAILVRCYDKTEEIRVNGNAKDFFAKTVWKGATEGEAVWRVEVQLRREVLKEIREGTKEGPRVPLDTLEGCLAWLGALWRYALGDGEERGGWISWRKRSKTEKTRSRWAVRKEWCAVRGVDWQEKTKNVGARKRARLAKAEVLEKQAMGCLTSIAALRGDVNFARVMENFVLHFEKELGGEAQAQARFRQLVRAKAIFANGELVREIDEEDARAAKAREAQLAAIHPPEVDPFELAHDAIERDVWREGDAA